MDTTLIVFLVVALAIVVVGVIGLMASKKKSQHLQDRFGPEYNRTLKQTGRRGEAEKALEQRATRVEKLHIKELQPEEQQRFTKSWRTVQTRFVDEPAQAI